MADIYLVKEKKGCGMFGVDCIVIFLAVSWFIPNIILSIVATLVGAAILYALMQIPVFGRIVVAICGLVVAFGVYSAVESLTGGFGKGKMSRMFTENPGMWWLLVIVGTLIFVGLHFVTCPKPASKSKAEIDHEEMYYDVPQPQQIFFSEDANYSSIDPDSEIIEDTTHIDEYNKNAEKLSLVLEKAKMLFDEINFGNLNATSEFIDLYNSSLDLYLSITNEFAELQNKAVNTDTITLMMITQQLEKLSPRMQSKLNTLQYGYYKIRSEQKEAPKNMERSFFSGCKTIDELNKRYRNLTKTFHPDIEAGDEETMKLINAEYEMLKREFIGRS